MDPASKELLKELADLSPYGEMAISKDSIKAAHKFIRLYGRKPVRISPTSSGGLLVEWIMDEMLIDIEFDPLKSIVWLADAENELVLVP